jgi:tetratricopeptide (TPR) repeat protein
MQEVISIFILNHYDVKTAEYYYQWLLKEVDSKDLERVKTFGKSIDYFKKVYFQIDSLESVKAKIPLQSYEWGIISLQQANLLYDIRREDDANRIYEQVYEKSVTFNEDPQNMHLAVLMKLSNYYLNKKEWDKAERFLNEQLAWLDSQNVPSNAEERGWILNSLCIAYMYRQEYEAANEMLNKAELILLPIYGKQSDVFATILHNKGRIAQLEGKLDEAKQLLEEAIQIQIAVNGKAMDRTIQYLDEVKHAIEIRL